MLCTGHAHGFGPWCPAQERESLERAVAGGTMGIQLCTGPGVSCQLVKAYVQEATLMPSLSLNPLCALPLS